MIKKNLKMDEINLFLHYLMIAMLAIPQPLDFVKLQPNDSGFSAIQCKFRHIML